jgi:hypothetical protein
MTLASGDEVRHISTRKPSQRPSEILLPSAKRLLQQYLPISDIDSLVSGDRKLKESTPWLAPGRPQPTTMGFDDRAADR